MASYADHAAVVTVNLTDPGTDGASGEKDVLTGIRDLVGGAGADTLVGDAQINDIHGGPGNDIVIGGNGPDTLFGDADNDDLRARDAEIDTVDCGAGADTATLDDIDLASNCDDATIIVLDADGDGAPAAGGVDCNDHDASIHPGASDTPGDGIDQNCAEGDAKLDADGDGFPGRSGLRRCQRHDPPRRARDRRQRGRRELRPRPTTLSQGRRHGSARHAVRGHLHAAQDAQGRRPRGRGDTVTLSCAGKGCKRSLKFTIAIKKRTPLLKLDSHVRGVRLKKGAHVDVAIDRASPGGPDLPLHDQALSRAPGAQRPLPAARHRAAGEVLSLAYPRTREARRSASPTP